MSEVAGVRTTDSTIASHKRLVYRSLIPALRAVFASDYDRDYQLADLKITQEFPYQKVDYPCIVLEYQNSIVENAGVGHVEWFNDPTGNLRQWNHRRFEGNLTFQIFALSTLDRDILSDALVEMISFGTLDAVLLRYYQTIYPLTANDWIFQQLMFNSDQIHGMGDSSYIAPWQPEDVLVYQTGHMCELHGGFYNTVATVDWQKIREINIEAYIEGTPGVDLPFPDQADIGWIPPFVYADEGKVVGEGKPSGEEV